MDTKEFKRRIKIMNNAVNEIEEYLKSKIELTEADKNKIGLIISDVIIESCKK